MPALFVWGVVGGGLEGWGVASLPWARLLGTGTVRVFIERPRTPLRVFRDAEHRAGRWTLVKLLAVRVKLTSASCLEYLVV